MNVVLSTNLSSFKNFSVIIFFIFYFTINLIHSNWFIIFQWYKELRLKPNYFYYFKKQKKLQFFYEIDGWYRKREPKL